MFSTNEEVKMKMKDIVRIVVFGAAYSIALSALAAEAAPDVGGVFPLTHGAYVAENADCGSPANAWLREYDGKGISGAHSHACTTVIRERRGETYVVDQTCTDAGTGTAPRSTERQQITVQDAMHFTQVSGGKRFDYRYCPVNQLPSDLQNDKR